MKAALFLLLSPAFAAAGPLEAQWEIHAATTATLGEPVALTGVLRSKAPADLALDLEGSSTSYYALGLVSQEAGKLEGGLRVQRFSLSVVPLGVGRMPVRTVWRAPGGEELQSPAATIDVAEPPMGSGEPRLQDIKPPMRARPALWPWLLAAALAALGWALYRRFKGREAQAAAGAAPQDLRPPEVIALEGLAGLEASGLWAAGRHKDFYVVLADILRVYLERRVSLPATRLTTAELHRHLREAEMPRSVAGAIRDVLDRADLVKFARIVPAPEDGPRDLEAAREVVRETTPKELAAGGAPA